MVHRIDLARPHVMLFQNESFFSIPNLQRGGASVLVLALVFQDWSKGTENPRSAQSVSKVSYQDSVCFVWSSHVRGRLRRICEPRHGSSCYSRLQEELGSRSRHNNIVSVFIISTSSFHDSLHDRLGAVVH